MPKVTPEQALAFLESLVGYVDLSENNGRPKSEHALTHLEAVLGRHQVPNSYDIVTLQYDYLRTDTITNANAEAVAKVTALLDYLTAVVEALRPFEDPKATDSL